MGCPKCQCDEISASGMCLWCGYQVVAPAAESETGSKENRDSPNKAETDNSRTSDESPQKALPQWRRELSQRLQSAKQKRKGSKRPAYVKSEILPSADAKAPASLQPSAPPSKIDPMVNSHTQDQEAGVLTSEQSSKRPDASARAEEVFIQPPAIADHEGGWMIILSRTLSGLVDLIIIALSSSALIVAVRLLSGMNVLDLVSIINCSVLFLLMYFMYSLFFLGLSNQTIGMMIMNLLLVAGTGHRPPHVPRILARCCCYLVSLLCLGIGLLWALFDREHQCLHDRLTHTRVVRLHNSASRRGGLTQPH